MCVGAPCMAQGGQIMPYPKCKIYSDGSHYIAIPHTTRPYKPRRKPREEMIAVSEESTKLQEQMEDSAPSLGDAPIPLEETVSDTVDCTEIADTLPEMPTANRLMTKKELFEELYARYQSLPRYKRKAAILKRSARIFPTRTLPSYMSKRICGARRAILSPAACV